MEQIVIEMLMVTQLVKKKKHAFCATRQTIPVFTRTNDYPASLDPVHTLTHIQHGTSVLPNSVCRMLHFYLSGGC
jgi:hypothetical protein